MKVLTAQWFITLFAYALGLKDTLRVWDYVFLGGWEAVFRVAVALLCCVEEEVGAVDEHEYEDEYDDDLVLYDMYQRVC